MVYKHISTYISEISLSYSAIKPLRSSHRGMLAVLHFREKENEKKKGQRTGLFSIVAPPCWNSLVEAIRQTESVNAFKMHLKTHSYFLPLIVFNLFLFSYDSLCFK